MGARKMRIRALMDDRPRLSYQKIAKQTGRSVPTISRWMAMEPTEEQAEIIERAIVELRKGQR